MNHTLSRKMAGKTAGETQQGKTYNLLIDNLIKKTPVIQHIFCVQNIDILNIEIFRVHSM